MSFALFLFNVSISALKYGWNKDWSMIQLKLIGFASKSSLRTITILVNRISLSILIFLLV